MHSLFGRKIYEKLKSERISPVPKEIREESKTRISGKTRFLPITVVSGRFRRKYGREERY